MFFPILFFVITCETCGHIFTNINFWIGASSWGTVFSVLLASWTEKKTEKKRKLGRYRNLIRWSHQSKNSSNFNSSDLIFAHFMQSNYNILFFKVYSTSASRSHRAWYRDSAVYPTQRHWSKAWTFSKLACWQQGKVIVGDFFITFNMVQGLWGGGWGQAHRDADGCPDGV